VEPRRALYNQVAGDVAASLCPALRSRAALPDPSAARAALSGFGVRGQVGRFAFASAGSRPLVVAAPHRTDDKIYLFLFWKKNVVGRQGHPR